jgi:hypothetical protein
VTGEGLERSTPSSVAELERMLAPARVVRSAWRVSGAEPWETEGREPSEYGICEFVNIRTVWIA